MKKTTTHNPTRRQAKHDLAPQRNRAQTVKGGIIIIVGGVPQLRAATLNP